MKLRISSGEGSSGSLVERIMSLHPYPVLRNLEHEPYLEIPRTTYFMSQPINKPTLTRPPESTSLTNQDNNFSTLTRLIILLLTQKATPS
jgi:hypothetical protein